MAFAKLISYADVAVLLDNPRLTIPALHSIPETLHIDCYVPSWASDAWLATLRTNLDRHLYVPSYEVIGVTEIPRDALAGDWRDTMPGEDA